MGEKLYALYDADLQGENYPLSSYLSDLRNEVSGDRNDGYTVSSFVVSNSTDVIYFSEDGFEYARLYCLFTMRQGTSLIPIEHNFLLRRDENSRWRILGWQKEDL